MGSRLKVIILIFFALLLGFIFIINFNEYRNMEDLRRDYPDLPERSYEYRKDLLKVWSIRLLLGFLLPLFFLTSGLSQRLGLSLGRDRGLVLSGFLYGVAFFFIVFIINLPINSYSSYILGHKYGLSNQTLWRWLELNLKGFLLKDLVMAFFLWIPYYLIKSSPRTWWLQMGALLIPVVIFMVFISPMFIDPIFNKYSSIEDEGLGQEISKLLDQAKIGGADIYMVDKSRDTKTMNAYMTGIFKSKRIVLWDTTIKNLSQDEVLSITAHEIGHYVRGHIWKSISLSIAGSFLLLYLVYLTSSWILEVSHGAFGFRYLYNYASLPLLLLVLNFYTFLGNPIMNYVSRYMEKEADAYEISLTEDRESAISAMEKLYVQSLGIPRPSKLYKLWYHSHPSLEERIEFYKSHPLDRDL